MGCSFLDVHGPEPIQLQSTRDSPTTASAGSWTSAAADDDEDTACTHDSCPAVEALDALPDEARNITANKHRHAYMLVIEEGVDFLVGPPTPDNEEALKAGMP